MASAAGQLVGVGATALAISVFPGTHGPLRDGPTSSTVVAALAAGLFQGAALGYAQSRVLRRYLPWLSTASWTLATAIGVGLAWLFALAAVQMFVRAPPALPVMTSVVAVVATGGLALGAVVGVAQWIVLRLSAPRAGTWVIASALGWAVGLVVAVSVASVPTLGVSALAPALQLVLGATLAGCAIGAACAGALVSILARPRAELTVYDRSWRG